MALILFSTIALLTKSYFRPKYNGELKLSGLKNKVTIYRDQYGVPHIDAQNIIDGRMALGFTMATDRLWQMEVLRRVAAGTLSEILGPKTINYDLLLRKLRLKRSMEVFIKNNYSKLDPQMIRETKAFLKGVNEFIKQDRLPIEFKILGYKPRPFTFVDTMSISGFVAFSFAEEIISTPLMGSLLKEHPSKAIRELLVKQKNDKTFTTKTSLKYDPTKEQWYQTLVEGLNKYTSSLGLFHGSNSWVLSGKKTVSGKPMLSNDPHIAFSNPSFWYEAHLKTPEHEMYGHFIPIVPFAGLGHNKYKAWAITMSEIDDLDIYLEKINPKNPNEVMYKNAWVPLIIENEIIKVKGEKDRKIAVKITPHGPILDDTKHALGQKHLSIKWAFHHPDNNIATTIYKLNYAKDLSELRPALSHATSPGFNISWADSKGNIAWHVMGKVPIRPKGVNGSFPLEGWSGKHEYLGYLKLSENPHLYNPKKGFIATANYYPEVDFGISHKGFWQPSDRIERINHLLTKKEKLNISDMKSIFTDDFVEPGKDIINIFNQILTQKNMSKVEKVAFQHLMKWNQRCPIESVGCTIFQMFVRKIVYEGLIDEFGEKRLQVFSRVADYWHFFKSFINNPNSYWWNNAKTKRKETRSEIVSLAFSKTIKSLTERFGNNISDWNWGKLHTVTYGHILGKNKWLAPLFNLGPFAAPAGYSQINNLGSIRGDFDFNVTFGPSTRRIVDFSNLNNSLGILPTGNSGVMFSKYYKNQSKMYLDGKFRAQIINMDLIKKDHRDKLVLNP